MTGPYFLAPQVSFCACDGQTVLMDPARDRYLQLSGAQAAWFSELEAPSGAGGLSEAAETFAARLAARGLLVKSAVAGRPVRAFAGAQACRDLTHEPAFVRPRAELQYAPATGLAIASASRLLARRALPGVLSGAAHWKRRSRPAPVLGRQIRLAARYHALTPYFMRTRDACKLHSAALVRFLSLFGEPAEWVFGVRLNPFGAHCWVQCGQTLLNDSLDRVREFRPILSV